MKLETMQINTFLDTLASDAPAPGGGSAAALCSSMGASLVIMVCNLTKGKKKYAEYDEFIGGVLAEALPLKEKIQAVIDRDTEAFNVVSAAYKLPKDTDEQKAARRAEIDRALLGAAAVPLELMRLSARALVLAESLIGKSNTSCASDLGVAALTLRTGIHGAWLNVKINIDGMESAEAAAMMEEGHKLLSESAL